MSSGPGRRKRAAARRAARQPARDAAWIASELVDWTIARLPAYAGSIFDTPAMRRAWAKALEPNMTVILARAAPLGYSRDRVLADLIAGHLEVRPDLFGGS